MGEEDIFVFNAKRVRAPKPIAAKGYGRCHLGNCGAHIQAQTLQLVQGANVTVLCICAIVFTFGTVCINITLPTLHMLLSVLQNAIPCMSSKANLATYAQMEGYGLIGSLTAAHTCIKELHISM